MFAYRIREMKQVGNHCECVEVYIFAYILLGSGLTLWISTTSTKMYYFRLSPPPPLGV